MIDKIQFKLFDIFTYALPGLFILLALIIIFDTSSKNIEDVILSVGKESNVTIGLLALASSYLMGHANDTIGSFLYKKFEKIFKKKPKSKIQDLSNSEKYILLRQFSKINFTYVETWNMLKGMSSNLASASLIFALCCLIKSLMLYPVLDSTWIILGIISIVLAIIFLDRATIFRHWANQDLDNSISILDLREMKLDSKKKD